jgi:hypothetical protein
MFKDKEQFERLVDAITKPFDLDGNGSTCTSVEPKPITLEGILEAKKMMEKFYVPSPIPETKINMRLLYGYEIRNGFKHIVSI